jgi:hypothetical protein
VSMISRIPFFFTACHLPLPYESNPCNYRSLSRPRYCKVSYSVDGLELDTKVQTRVICLVM